ncbi:glycosyltransferase [Bacteroides sp.]|uniref:glycosyltransferase family 2 protein n=1 Tax=Bacteroides sp. TaxID=29523 RepID=UPI0026077C44|nr:glycosyltransferase [Bacteroides sp.]MDD3036338.1 glycosyltransferase [Bacteroides sp.]
MENSITVTICCLTYNHEKFVKQCLDGFIMQKTNFHFEVLIHDDASTDKTQEIIREYATNYPDIIKPVLQKENQYSKGIRAILATFCYPQAKGKYIAICEGDDYWIDPLKLQKQVDFLENNPDYAMVYTRSNVYDQRKCRIEDYLIGREFNDFNDLLIINRIPTLITCIRTNILIEYTNDIKPEKQNWLMGDYPIWLWIAYHYKIKFFPEVTSVYRDQLESASHSQDLQKQEKFALSVIDITTFYIKKFEIVPTKEYWEAVNATYYHYYDIYIRKGDYKKAKRYANNINLNYTTDRIRKKIRLFHFRYIKFKVRALFKIH